MAHGRPAHTFPFTAIVGQNTLKTALLLNAVDPRVGGVLIRGEKGTAKSTAVRALGAILPEIDVVEGCAYSCDPSDPGSWCVDCRERRDEGTLPKAKQRPRVVNLPVSATEDRLVGTIDLEHALKHGVRSFEPGLLAHANRAILYVDEVNLLDDHLVDTLLDAAAMGVNSVEREGISFTHPSRFQLIGTMNPEEGDIRPQLLDRFGLCVDVVAERDQQARVDVIKRRRAFEEDPGDFLREWTDAQDELQLKLRHAILRLPSIDPDDVVLNSVAGLCAAVGVDGHRADLVMVRAAVAHAALNGASEVTLQNVSAVAPLVLAHRMKRTPFGDDGYDEEIVQTAVKEMFDSAPGQSDSGENDGQQGGLADGALAAPGGGSVIEPGGGETVDQAVARLVTAADQARRTVSGRRASSISGDSRGRYLKAEAGGMATSGSDIAFDATLRNAAVHQSSREGELAIQIKPSEVMTKVRKRKIGTTIIFCVDASGSMGAASRMGAAKQAVLQLLVDAYQRRDRVGLVSFRGNSAELALAPTASVELAQVKLKQMPTGGATPLAHGILRSLEVVDSEIRRDERVVPWIVLVTDGRANVGLDGGLGSEDARAAAVKARASAAHVLVIDTCNTVSRGSAAKDIAEVAGAEYVQTDASDVVALTGAVKKVIG